MTAAGRTASGQLLLTGAGARHALRELLNDAHEVPAVAIDPIAREGAGPIAVMAVATRSRAVLIDPASTPGLADILAQPRPWGAHRAKAVHRALLRTVGAGPERWACVHVTEQLLAGGRDWDLGLAQTARRHGEAQPPALDRGFCALCDHAKGLARILAAQIPRLKAAGLTRVSRIEAAAVSAVAELEHRGMPIAADSWRRLTAEATKERAEIAKRVRLHLGKTQVGGALGKHRST